MEGVLKGTREEGPRTRALRTSSVGKTERDVLARVAPAADRHDDVLLAVDHVGHRRSALWGWHESGAHLLAGRIVVRTQHRAARMLGRRRDLRIAHHDDRFGVHQPDARYARLA